MVLHKISGRHLFWAFQAVFLSVLFYAGRCILFKKNGNARGHRCRSYRNSTTCLHNYMKTLDKKHIRPAYEEGFTSSDMSEDTDTWSTTMYTGRDSYSTRV
ncbi:hypothetical protein NEMIN01_2513 [Nematocida minor]|uniref:uncharacterized protein n=1 Tax=Nematocida minor TaxID=1912983 RepID=UPI00221F5FB7|nr:uncharacterized protein NEMIN01_2513 [Nematocida minor]KAI5193379.1 hypothetical protein NEMIN01_2513 [Nematocida minor]